MQRLCAPVKRRDIHLPILRELVLDSCACVLNLRTTVERVLSMYGVGVVDLVEVTQQMKRSQVHFIHRFAVLS
jgi:hypothetical protein